mgnify:CR=1 FL=1
MLENRLVKKVLKLQIISLILLGLIITKLSYSQIILHEEIEELAENMWNRSFPLEASRGNIIDRNGKVIATNLPTLSIITIPYQIKDKKETSKVLAKHLKVKEEIIYNKINKRTSMVRLSPEGRKISDELALEIEKENLRGVYIVQDNLRYYPYNTLLSQSLGFVGIDNQGLAGLENYYEEVLKGQNGSMDIISDAKGGLFGNYLKEVNSPVQGMTLELTINLELQKALERELYNNYLTYHPDSIYGISMDPNNGEILAIASYPTFDPNKYQEYNQEIYNRNLPIWKSYEPGSTFKVFSFAAGLDQKKFDMYKDVYYDKGYEYVGGQRIKSWKKGGHGLQTYLEVLQNSSNPGFVSIARKLGKDNIYNYIKNFGFSKKTNVDLPGETSGIFFKYENFNELEQATSSFGQGVSVSMIQMASAFSSVINGGNLYEPHIVKGIVNSKTNEKLVNREPVLVRNTIKKETSDLMRIALESVVAKGSGGRAFIDNYRVGGKTGTSQIVGPDGTYLDGEYILSFIGAFPMNDPKIVTYICVERPRNCIQYGGTIAAPIVKNVFMDAIDILNIDKQSNQIEKVKSYYDEEMVLVPNYIGLNKKDIKKQYFNIIYHGNGNKVIDQLPKANEKVKPDSTILIMLGD